MSGSKSGGQKAAQTMLKKHGKQFFQVNGRLGGMMSKRGKAKNGVRKNTNRPG